MKLLKEIEDSLIEQKICSIYKSDGSYDINASLIWSNTKEGYLFWHILYDSHHYNGIYDYITLIKLYNRYGKYIFRTEILRIGHYVNYSISKLYSEYSVKNTLSDKGFNLLCEEIEKDGINRVC